MQPLARIACVACLATTPPSIASTTDDAGVVRPPVIVTTLQMDPESPRPIVGWWIADEGLIELDGEGGYRRWSDHDRLARPTETGRWHRENHAVFWLEPYTLPKAPRKRAALWLRDGALMANLNGATAAYRHAASPPRIAADDLLGDWRGSGGTLQFRADSTYHWTAPEDTAAAPARIGGQRGRWRLGPDRRLRLEPLVIGQSPVLVALVRDPGATPDPGDDRIVEIQSVAGTLRRVDREPPSGVSIPANPAPPTLESSGDATSTNEADPPPLD